MPNPDMTPAWQTPLRDLHLARVLFRKLRANMVTWQIEEYDVSILSFLRKRQLQGKPFPQDFSNDPDDIKRLKNLENALYLAEQAFDKLGSLNLAGPRSYNPKLITEAYEACHLLLGLMTDAEQNFRDEINVIASGLDSLLDFVNNPNTARASFTSHDVGLTIGRAIEQRTPTSGQNDYDLLTYCGAVFPSYPAHIQYIRTSVEKITSRNPEYTPNFDQQKMDKLLTQGQQLTRTITNSNQNSLYFVVNLISLIRQTHTLWTHIYEEGSDLNDTMQNLGREYLALLKYELLPAIFRGVDKLELQLMLKPGRLSKPLMEQIKPWYEILVQTAKPWIKFDESNEHLLKIENRRFIELRIQPLQAQLETSVEVLHFVDLALKALNAYLQNPKETIPLDLQQHILALTPYMLDTDKDLLARVNTHMKYSTYDYMRDATYDYMRGWYNYSYAKLSREEAHDKPKPANIERQLLQLRQLKQRWEQLKPNHMFKKQRYEQHINSIQEQAHRVLYPSKSDTPDYHVSEKKILENTYFLPENQPQATEKKTSISYHDVAQDTHVVSPKKLSAHASWELYRAYERQIKQLKQATTNCDHLINALKHDHAWQAIPTLNFASPYQLDLLEHNVMHQPQRIYVKIEDDALQCHVLKAHRGPCKLYLMTLESAKDAGHQGYIWDHDQNQLSYIAEDGHIRAHIRLEDHALSLKGLIKAKNTMLKLALRNKESDENEHVAFQLGDEEIYEHITSLSGHHPGIIQKSSIPLADLGCPLTELTTLEPLYRYSPHIFNELHERGHTQNEFKSNCIRWYDSIQPYVSNLDFDARITRLFSGSFTAKTSKNVPDVSFSEANTEWRRVKQELLTQIQKLTKKRDTYKQQTKNQTFTHPSELSTKLKHREFLLDTAQFMSSTAPIRRQLHNSNKTCFKINLALECLKTYAPHTYLSPTDYPWFQDVYVGPLSHTTASEIETQLHQILAYETLQITRNKQLLTQLKPLVSDQTSTTYIEDDAFKYFGHIYEPVVMQEESQKKPGELQLRIESDLLHYKFMHYGEELEGEIALQNITPALIEFNERTVVPNETLRCILNIAYTRRKQMIDSKLATPSPEEALDLYQWYLDHHENSDKRALYKLNAEKKPAAIEKKQEENAPENRTNHLIKHIRLSQYLHDLKSDIYKHVSILSTPLKQALNLDHSKHLLPYPEVGAQNWLIDLLKEAIQGNVFIATLNLPNLHAQPKDDTLSALKEPQQVLLLKRLMNIIHYLEQIVLEMEKITDKDAQISYVIHLVVSYFYVQHILPLLSEIKNDPLFPVSYTYIEHKINSVYDAFNIEKKYYVETNHPDDKDKKKQTALHSLLNMLKMLPHRLDKSTADFEIKHAELKQATEKSVHNIEKIIQHYHSSWSYILLLLDVPTVQHVLSDMRRDIESLFEHSHKATQRNLSKLKTKYLQMVMLEADRIEHKLGLAPGLISHPIQEIFGELYQGFITPLTPELNQQVQLLCGNNSLDKRIKTARLRQRNAKTNIAHFEHASQTMQTLLDACDAFDNHKSDQTKIRLNQVFQATLPTLKASLNSSDVYLSSIQVAQQKKRQDCFVFDVKKSQLYHIDAEGELNPQTGCRLFLRSIPDSEEMPLNLIHRTSRKFPFGYTINIEKEYPTIVQHKDKYFLYANTDAKGWQYTELNAEVIANMRLNFSRTQPLDIHTKYQEMYDEIAAKTGMVYSIRLKNTFKTLRFLTKKTEANKTPDGPPEKLYLSEHTIHEYVNSNSDFSFRRQRLSINPGCCLISLKTKPTDYYELELPAGYNSYYAQVGKNTDVLYYIDTETSSITPLPISKIKQGTDAVKALQDARKNEIFDAHDFKNMEYLTGHACCLISLDTEPTDFDKLRLPVGYGSYYARVGNNIDVLYYIDRTTRSIIKLPIAIEKQKTTENEPTKEIKKLKNTQIHKAFNTNNFKNIAYLTDHTPTLNGHTPEASLMLDINHFTPDAQSFEKLRTLAKRSKAYYQGMIKTAKIDDATADEQLAYLSGYRFALLSSLHGDFTKAQGRTVYWSETPKAYFVKGMKKERLLTKDEGFTLTDITKKLNDTDFQKAILAITSKAGHTFLKSQRDEQKEKYIEIKKAIYTDHFNQTARSLASETVELQRYTLHPLTENTILIPNRLYIKFRDGAFDYRVINPAGKQRKSYVKLNQISWPQNKQPESIDELIPYLPEILKITSTKGDGHTRPHTLADDYKTKLTQALNRIKYDTVDRAVKSGGPKAIDAALTHKKEDFNNEHFEHYEQLDAINQAVGEFRLYLKRTKKQINKTSSFFESTDTIQSKMRILNLIDTYSSDINTNPKDRIAAIQEYLQEPGISDDLMAYCTYTSTSLKSLLQCVFRLFEAVGLYTPEMTQRLDKIVDTVKRHEPPPPPANNPWSFFSKTTREKIKEKISTPKPSDAGP